MTEAEEIAIRTRESKEREEREAREAAAIERLLPGEEGEVEQYRKEGRLWQSVSLTTANWTNHPRQAPEVTALADTGQFTVTGGYAKINVVEVPRRRGISVFAGYDPIAATLPVLLLDMPYGNPAQKSIVERQCAILEWMAGRGKPINGAPAPAPMNQAPYAVKLSSVSPAGHSTLLVPANYNSVVGGVREWFVTGIQWGDSLRDREGKRRKQHLVLTLTENVPLEGANEANASHQAGGIGKWHPYTVKRRGSHGESVEQIVVFVLKIRDKSQISQVEKAILKHNREHKPAEMKGKAVDSPLKAGSTISIPGEI